MRYDPEIDAPDDDPIKDNEDLNNTFYELAYQNTFTPEELQWRKVIKKSAKLHKKLNLMDPEEGYEKYIKLNNETKKLLVAFHGEDNGYMQTPENLLGKARLFAGLVLSSPFKVAFDAAEEYGKKINAVTLYTQNAMQNGSPESIEELVRDGYRALNDQESFYDNEMDARLTEKHGKIKSYIAKEILKGKTPGEVIKGYGKLTPEFIDAMSSFMEEQDLWNDGILEDFRQAKLSPGRTFANFFLGERGEKGGGEFDKIVKGIGKTFGMSDKEIKKSLKEVDRDKFFTAYSGTADAITLVLTDPLTYLTGGGSAGWRFMGKAFTTRSKVMDMAKANNIKGYFSEPKVIEFWDAYGSRIKDLSKAVENKQFELASKIRDDIKLNFRRFNADDDIDLAVKNEFFDAKSTYEYFDKADNFAKLIAGKVSGTSYHKIGLPVARDIRRQGIGLRKIWYDFATGSKTFKNINIASEEFANELMQVGAEKGIGGPTPVLDKAFGDLNKFRNYFIKYVSLHPGDEAIEMGENAAQSIEKVRRIFRLMAPRDLADAAVERFAVATTAERFQMMAGAYKAIAIQLGIDKLPNGMEQIDKLVNSKFGGIGMTRGVANDAAGWGPLADNFVDDIEGSLFDFQGTSTIGNFDWNELQKLAADAAVLTLGGSSSAKTRLGGFVGGLANNRVSDFLVRSWTYFALLPKLGIRSTIDEQFIFIISAPPKVLFNYFSGIAKSGGKALTRYTADDKATGIVGNLLRKTVVKPLGLKGFDPVNEITEAERHELLKAASDYVEANNLPIEAVMPIFEELLATRAVALSRLIKNKPDLASDTISLIRFYPNALDSAYASVAKSIGGKTVEKSKSVNIVEETQLTKAHDAFELNKVNNFYLISPRDLIQEDLKLVMYDAFYMTFYNAKVSGLDLTEQFIKYNGLKDGNDLKLFIDDFVTYLTDPNAPTRWKRFATQRRGVELLQQKGLSNAQIAEKYARKIARDMYKTFHGDESYYKQDLVDFFKNNPDPALNMATIKEIMGKLSFDEYSKLIGDKLRKTDIATNIDPKTIKDPKGRPIEMGNKASDAYNWTFDVYDRTVTSMHRQPAVFAYYYYYRDMFRKGEQAYKDQMINDMLENLPAKVLEKIDVEKIATDRTEKYFVEHAMNNAVHSVLKFADNPHVRSNVVTATRNVNRFARAAEDFWRRVYRLKDVTPRAIYRLRLINNGLNGVGTQHEDAEGNKYFVIPNDNILFAAINPVFETLTGEGFVSPNYGEQYTFNFSSVNPSFQDQAGIPFIAGPVGALPVFGLQAIARSFGGNVGEKFAEDVDTIAFGDMGDNAELKSLMPPIITRLMNMFDADETAEHNHSAILSSIASHQAAGLGISPNATAKEKMKYLESLRTGAHNFMFMRSLLGTILPFSLNSKENFNVPDYVKDTGIPDIRSEYYDILFAVLEKYGNDVHDPFEVANTIFAGKYPNELVYTISRSKKETKAIVAQTKQTKDWILSNMDFIKSYQPTGAAYFFAPQVGDAYPGMYKWLQKTGLTDTIPDTEYLDAMLVLEDKQRYFDISDWEREELSKVADYESRKRIIAEATRRRKMLKDSNPLLEDALTPDGGFSVVEEESIIKDIKNILDDKSSPITKAQRKSAKEALKIFDNGYNYITNPIVSQINNSSQLKLGTRNATIDELRGIAEGDPFLTQLNNKLFFPVLKFYSRNTFSASAVG